MWFGFRGCSGSACMSKWRASFSWSLTLIHVFIFKLVLPKTVFRSELAVRLVNRFLFRFSVCVVFGEISEKSSMYGERKRSHWLIVSLIFWRLLWASEMDNFVVHFLPVGTQRLLDVECCHYLQGVAAVRFRCLGTAKINNILRLKIFKTDIYQTKTGYPIGEPYGRLASCQSWFDLTF